MNKSNAHQIEAHHGPSLEEQAFLDVVRCADRLQSNFARWLKPHGISPTQYNALRILRGAGERGLPCSEVGERMIARDPDVTRLIDRLERRGLALRGRDPADRRVNRAHITRAGLELLEGLDKSLQPIMREMLGHMGRERLEQLARLTEAACSTLAD